VSVVPAKVLLDENISPKVAERLAREDGIDACHVRDRGLLAATDRDVLERAFAEDRILVTSNVGDFLKLARAREIHCGVILPEDGALPREEQLRLVRSAVLALRDIGDLTNKALWVAPDGSTRLEDVPPA
jgi:predicted nuclease of predicted toxin-antitoxin system